MVASAAVAPCPSGPTTVAVALDGDGPASASRPSACVLNGTFPAPARHDPSRGRYRRTVAPKRTANKTSRVPGDSENTLERRFSRERVVPG